MAERIDSLDRVAPPNRHYPWEEWTDGSAWLIRHGADFTCTTSTMRSNLVTRAARLGLHVTSHVSAAEPDVVRFQFYKRSQS